MRRRKTFLIWLGVLLILGAALLLFEFVVSPSSEQWRQSRILSTALRDARSVNLVEFTPHYVDVESGKVIDREVLFQQLTATRAQIEALESATDRFLTFQTMMSMKGCFTPHHRVEIVRTNGTLTNFTLCFKCENFKFDSGDTQPIPAAWLPRLTRFFSAAGMPPRTDEEYHELAYEMTKD
jgi:hypothetical protein